MLLAVGAISATRCGDGLQPPNGTVVSASSHIVDTARDGDSGAVDADREGFAVQHVLLVVDAAERGAVPD